MLKQAVLLLLREQLERWYYERETKIGLKLLDSHLSENMNEAVRLHSIKIAEAEELLKNLEASKKGD